MGIQILGPLAVRGTDGVELALAGPRHRKILAALLLQPNRLLSTSRLIDVIWPDSPPATAREQVQNCVSLLRRQLTGSLAGVDIVRQPTGYRIHVDDGMLDAVVFRGLVRSAELCAADGDTERARELLRRSLLLWNGRVLEDVDAAELAPAKIHLEELQVCAVIQYAKITERSDRIDAEFLADLRQWISLLPYHEGLVATLARLLHRGGRTSDALDIVRDLRRRVRDELGLCPGAEIERLEREILLGAVPGDVSRNGEDFQQLRELLTSAVEGLSQIAQLVSHIDRRLAALK